MVSHLRPTPFDGWKLQGPHRPQGFAELLSSAQWAAELLAALPGRAGNPRINRSTWKMLRVKTECSCSFWVSVFLKVMIQVSLYTCIYVYIYIHTLQRHFCLVYLTFGWCRLNIFFCSIPLYFGFGSMSLMDFPLLDDLYRKTWQFSLEKCSNFSRGYRTSFQFISH